MRIIKKVINYILIIIGRLIGKVIDIRVRPLIRIKTHQCAVSDGTSMQYYVDLVKKFCNFTPKNIFEIGANFGQDAEYLRKSFFIEEKNVYVFEPHPQIFKELNKLYKFNNYELAVSNEVGRANFHAIDIENNEYKNSGISSLKNGLTTDKKNFIEIDVKMIRMDEFISKNKIEEVDFLKIDVEGVNYEVIEGFGNEITKVKVIQTEGEYRQYWEGQKLYSDMEQYLVKNGFLLIDFKLSSDGIQSDSLWVQKKYIK
jgi:FkbM family methyltransferase